jgi:photosystem II stability/assembly factor-like uncharacterized protein
MCLTLPKRARQTGAKIYIQKSEIMCQITRKLLLFIFVLSSFAGKAQTWMEPLNHPNPKFQDIQDAFNAYWKDKPEEKGKGIKAFRRWEWHYQNRHMEDGTLPPPSINYDEWKKYQETHPVAQLRPMDVQAANWTFKGPAISNGGYIGLGRLACIAFHPTDANTFWVGSAAGGLWKTTDGGNTWSSNTDNLPVLGVSDIAIDPTDPNIMYIATGDGDAGDCKSLGVMKTTNGGATWSTTGLSYTTTQLRLIRRMLINPTNPQILIAAANDGIWRTTNGGTSWTNIQSGNYSDLEFKPGDPSIVYASTMAGTPTIYRSSNSGQSFSFVQSFSGAYRLNMGVSAADPTLVDVLVCNTAYGLLGLWASTNSGTSFTQYFTGTTSNNMLNSNIAGSGSGGQGFYDLAYAINPTNANEIWIGGVNSWKTLDGGANWLIKNYWVGNGNGVPVVHADKHFIAFHPLQPGTMFECNDGGLYKTVNGGTSWTDLSNGLGISQIYKIGPSTTLANDVMAGLQDNGSKEMVGTSWFDRVGGDGMDCLIDHTNGNTKYSSYVYGQIYKSTNGGAWNVIVSNSGTGVNETGNWLSPFVMHPTDNLTLLLGKNQVYKTTNGGTSWTQLGTLGGSSKVNAIAYAPSNPLVIYVCTNSELIQTVDGGVTWNFMATTSAAIPWTSIAVSPLDPQKIWVTKAGYTATSKVLTSSDGGTTFTNITGTLPNLPVNTVVYQNGTNDAIYIGNDIGVFYRDGSMTDWIAFQTGLPNVEVAELEISYINNKIWAGTYGRGLWNSDLYAPGTSGCLAAAPASSGNPTVCQNTLPAVLTATSASGYVTDWYSASSGGTLLLAGSNTYTTSTAGTYYAESRNPSLAGCVSTRTAITLGITALPSQPVISQSGSTLSSSVATGNQWYLNGTAISGATGQNYTPTTSGQYTVLSTSNGCAGPVSATFSYVISGIVNPTWNQQLIIAPNPVHNVLNIKYTGNLTHFTMMLMDISGRQVLATAKFTSSYAMNMQRYPSGSYLVRIINDKSGEQVQRQIVKAD